MGRAPCCDKAKVKRGAWSPEEDAALTSYLHAHHGSPGNWISLPHKAGLKRCGKSCRLRWLNYLRPHIKRGGFTEEEDNIILSFYSKMGSRWSVIAANLPGRTDNDVKNHWNTKLKKKLFAKGEENPKKMLANNEANCNTTTIQFTSNGNPNNSLLNYHPQHLYLPSFASLLAQGNSIYESSSSLGHPSTLPIDQLMLASSLNYPHREHLGPILVHDQISQSQEARSSTISESTSLVDQPQYCLSNPFYSSNEEDVLVFGDAALGFGSTFINNPYDNELLVVEEAGFGH